MNVEDLTARARICIRKPPAQVCRAFTAAEEMSKFWFTRRDGGLKQGETVSWFIGSGKDAPSVDVHVKLLREPEKIELVWGNRGSESRVLWTFERTPDNDTVLTVEESGFSGDADAIIERALDSTGGFNQVIVAAKALIEHGVAINVIADHG